MKLTPAHICAAAQGLLDEVGLDGLTMRLVAGKLGVRPGALYWHVKNKQDLLDALASQIFNDAVDGLEAPRASVGWQEWLGDLARRFRRAMLRHSDGARIFAGCNLSEPVVFRATELALRTLQDVGFPVRTAARAVASLMHYTVGFTLAEQAHLSAAKGMADDSSAADAHGSVDSARFPLTAQAYETDQLFDHDTDACFEYGLLTILAGMQITNEPTPAV